MHALKTIMDASACGKKCGNGVPSNFRPTTTTASWVQWAKNATVMNITNSINFELWTIKVKTENRIFSLFALYLFLDNLKLAFSKSNSGNFTLAGIASDVYFLYSARRQQRTGLVKSFKAWKTLQSNLTHQRNIGGAPTNYRRRRRADQNKSAAAPTNCRRWRRGAADAVLYWKLFLRTDTIAE